MARKVRSARGELVDFDYLKIKEQLASAPPPVEVKNRQDFIENRLKRRMKKRTSVEKTEVNVEPKLPEPEETKDLSSDVKNVDDNVEVKKTETTKQKARRRKNTSEDKE